jgi:hypothetical protein
VAGGNRAMDRVLVMGENGVNMGPYRCGDAHGPPVDLTSPGFWSLPKRADGFRNPMTAIQEQCQFWARNAAPQLPPARPVGRAAESLRLNRESGTRNWCAPATSTLEGSRIRQPLMRQFREREPICLLHVRCRLAGLNPIRQDQVLYRSTKGASDRVTFSGSTKGPDIFLRVRTTGIGKVPK